MDSEQDKIQELLKQTTTDAQSGNFKNVMKVLNEKMDMNDPTKLMLMLTLATLAEDKGRTDIAYNIFSRVYSKLSSEQMLGPEHKDVVSLCYRIGNVTNSISEAYKCFSASYEIATRNNYTELAVQIKEKLNLFMENLPHSHKSLYNKLYTKLNINHKKHKSNKPQKGVKQHLSTEEIDALMLEYDLN